MMIVTRFSLVKSPSPGIQGWVRSRPSRDELGLNIKCKREHVDAFPLRFLFRVCPVPANNQPYFGDVFWCYSPWWSALSLCWRFCSRRFFFFVFSFFLVFIFHKSFYLIFFSFIEYWGLFQDFILMCLMIIFMSNTSCQHYIDSLSCTV